jgi:hypothetical protein
VAVALYRAIGMTFLCFGVAVLASSAPAATTSQFVQFNITIRDRATLTLPGQPSRLSDFQQVSPTFSRVSAKLRTGRTTPVEILLSDTWHQNTFVTVEPRVITWNGHLRSARSLRGPGHAVVMAPDFPNLHSSTRSPWSFFHMRTEITIITP